MASPGNGVVISESVAKRYWPSRDPVGQALTIFRSSQDRPDFGRPVPSVVIGVVGDVRHFGLDDKPTPDVYVPLAAEPWPHGSLVARVRSTGLATAAALRRAVAEVDPDIPVPSFGAKTGFEPVAGYLASALAPRRYLLGLIGSFSVCALLLAAIGVYGVTSYAVARRTHELGIRIALGATPRDALALVVRHALTLATAGIIVGAVSALLLTRLVTKLLYATSPNDVAVFVGVPAMLLVVAVVASYLPARRAARVDPTVALRAE
jgi:putative ABC transport system permease protein